MAEPYYIVKFNKPVFIHHVANKKQFRNRVESIHKFLFNLKANISSLAPGKEKDEQIERVHEYERYMDHYVKINTTNEDNEDIELLLDLLLETKTIDSYF